MHYIEVDLKFGPNSKLYLEFMFLEIERFLARHAAFNTYLEEETDT